MHMFKHLTYMVRLDAAEQFEVTNEDGNPIQVSEISWSPDSEFSQNRRGMVGVSGYGIKKDRTLSVLRRRGSMFFSDLPQHVQEALREDYLKTPVLPEAWQ